MFLHVHMPNLLAACTLSIFNTGWYYCLCLVSEHAATLVGGPQLAKPLLQGKSALVIACSHGNLQLVEMLLLHGASISGNTGAWHWCKVSFSLTVMLSLHGIALIRILQWQSMLYCVLMTLGSVCAQVLLLPVSAVAFCCTACKSQQSPHLHLYLLHSMSLQFMAVHHCPNMTCCCYCRMTNEPHLWLLEARVKHLL